MKPVAENKKSYHYYFIHETVEAGLVLQGCEIKSIRKGSCQLKDSYIILKDGEAYIIGMHISPYKQATWQTADPLRTRKLLLSKQQLRSLERQVKMKGYTLVPLQIYFSGRWAKMQIAVASGKKLHDKRQALKEKDLTREAQREVASF